MTEQRNVDEFWRGFCTGTSGIDPNEQYQVWFFGNTQEMALELASLVMSGKKTATASLAEVNKLKPEQAPIIDGCSVVTDLNGIPLCVIQTSEIAHLAFEDVGADFAADEGEGDQTLEYWRDAHWRYFTKEAAELDLDFDQRSIVCCERFRLLYPR